MKLVQLSETDQLELKMLGRSAFEVNGQISVKEGKVTKIQYRKGQIMEPCYNGCVLNFHTHPPDYDTLYPDHPSATDFKYIHKATCQLKELSAHLVCTPKYLYVIYYKCKNPIFQCFDLFTIRSRIDAKFKKLALNFDRAGEDFRQAWMKEMCATGFNVQRYSWGDEIGFLVPEFRFNLYQKLIFVILIVIAARVIFFT